MSANQWSVVVPVLNDAENLAALLPPLVAAGYSVVVSDGGSSDDSVAIANGAGAKVVQGAFGRGAQLQLGLQYCQRPWVWFLHSDTQLTLPVLKAQLDQLQSPCWGRFDVSLTPAGLSLNFVAKLMNWRSRLTKICTGDQGMFAHRQLLDAVGGVPQIPLMEDVELSKRLRQSRAHFVALPGLLVTSARRWQQAGIFRTVMFMWRCRLRYWAGTPATTLAAEYYPNQPAAPKVAPQ